MNLLRFLLALFLTWSVNAFTAAPVRSVQRSLAPSTELHFFGQAKDDGSPGDYVCKVSVFFLMKVVVENCSMQLKRCCENIGLWLCIYQRTSGVGGVRRPNLQVSSLWGS